MNSLKILFVFFLINIKISAQKNINLLDANGNRTGQWGKKYNNGKTRYKGQFLNGKEIGYFYYYKEYNQKMPYITKYYEKDNPISKVKFFYPDGVLESEGNMKDKERIGKWLYYFHDGESILLEENYENGKLSGESKIFYKDGTLTEISFYKNGKLHGNRKQYTNKGILITDVNYYNGIIHGEITYYDNQGIIIEKGFYDQGKKVGKWEFYVNGLLSKTKEPNKRRKDTLKLEKLLKRKKQSKIYKRPVN